jgi:molecular chaperone GrpE (heat shock protein)
MADESSQEQTESCAPAPGGPWAAGHPAATSPAAPPAAAVEESREAEGPTSQRLVSEQVEAAVAAGFVALVRALDDKLALDRFREDQIARLHEELQGYRSESLREPVRQVLRGVIRLHDNLGKLADALRSMPATELTPERFLRQLAGLQDDVELLLDEHGVTPFTVEGEQFDPCRQTALRTVETGDSGSAGRVAKCLRPGFAQGDVILQKQRVAVYVASAASNALAQGGQS